MNDLVLKLNDLDVTNIDRRSAKQAIRKQGTLIMVGCLSVFNVHFQITINIVCLQENVYIDK